MSANRYSNIDNFISNVKFILHVNSCRLRLACNMYSIVSFKSDGELPLKTLVKELLHVITNKLVITLSITLHHCAYL